MGYWPDWVQRHTKESSNRVSDFELAARFRMNFDDNANTIGSHDSAQLDGGDVRSLIIEPPSHGRIERDIVDLNEDLGGLLGVK